MKCKVFEEILCCCYNLFVLFDGFLIKRFFLLYLFCSGIIGYILINILIELICR